IVQNYLHSKYDLAGSLTGDRFDGDTAGNGEHDFGLFGVANVGGDLVLDAGSAGFGIEVAALDDGDSLLAAHDAGTGKSTAGIPGGIESRWGRTWYADVTNATAPATLTFDYSDAGLTLASESSFTLLRSNDGVTWSAVPGQTHLLDSPSVAGDTITFNDVSLTDGWYTMGDASTFPLL